MLCRRSASLISTTRMSCAIAMIILRKFSACFSSRLEKVIFETLVTPSTSRATSGPNSPCTSSSEAPVSSTTSCKQAGDDRGHVEPELRDYQRDVERMDYVRLAGFALLLDMHPRRIFVGATDQARRRPAGCRTRTRRTSSSSWSGLIGEARSSTARTRAQPADPEPLGVHDRLEPRDRFTHLGIDYQVVIFGICAKLPRGRA